MPDSKRYLAIAYGAILSILAALITAMLSTEGNVWTRIKTFIAGVSCGILMHLILTNVNMAQVYKDIIATGGAAFVSTIWPTLGVVYNKYLKNHGTTIQNTKRD